MGHRRSLPILIIMKATFLRYLCVGVGSYLDEVISMAVPVTTNSFHWADYLVFALTLVISAVIGIYYAYKDKKRQNSAEFLLGGRKMSTFPVTLSLMASFLSAVMVLGVPTEIFAHGTMYWLIAFSNILTFPMAAHAFLPVFHNLRLSSAYEVSRFRLSISN